LGSRFWELIGFYNFAEKGLILVFGGFNILFVWVWESFICNVVQGKV